MALRKFSRYMKVVTVIVIIAFLFTTAYAGYSYFTSFLANRKTVMLKFDNQKIYKQDFDKELQNIKASLDSAYTQKSDDKDFVKVPDKEVKEIVLVKMLEKSSFNILSNNLKVSVSNSEIDSKVKELQDKFGGEDKFNLVLAQNRTNLTVLKENIKQNLIYEHTLKALESKINVTDEQLKEQYDRSRFSVDSLKGKTFDEAKNDVKQLYLDKNVQPLLNSNLNDIFLKATVSTKEQDIKDMIDDLRKETVTYKDLQFYKKDLISDYIQQALQSDKGYTDEEIKKVNDDKEKALEKIYSIAEKAKAAGIEVPKELDPMSTAQLLVSNYFNYLVDSYKPTEQEMQDWFNNNKARYDTQNTISGNLIGVKYKPSEADFDRAKAKAEEIMKTLTDKNFAEVAKKESKDPGSAEKGGDLGMQDVRKFVPQFADALNHPVGTIYGPVKTQFGYHIIEVVEKDKNNPNNIHLRHILITPEISEETKKADIAKLDEVKGLIQSGKLTIEDLKKEDSKYSEINIAETFKDLTKDAAFPEIGPQPELMEELFKADMNKFVDKDFKVAYISVEKTSEIPYKSATFDEFKEQIRVELGLQYASSQFSK